MIRFYEAYVKDVTLEFDPSSLIEKYTLAFEDYLDDVKKSYKEEYENYLISLSNILPKGETIYIRYRNYLSSLIEYDSANVLSDSFYRMRFLPQYLRLECLVDLIGRKKAIEFTKSYIDRKLANLPRREDAPQSIENLRLMQIEANLEGKDMDWIVIKLSENSYCNIVTKCRIHQVLKDYDKELMEVVACYPDFMMFKAINPHFILTRTQTLIGGGECCDTCYHDARNKEFSHPKTKWFQEHLNHYL